MNKSKLPVMLASLCMLLGTGAKAGIELVDMAMNQDMPALKQALRQPGTHDLQTSHEDGSTALHWAIHWNDMEAVSALIDAGADVMAETRLGATPLYLAAMQGNAAALRALLAAGADPSHPVLFNAETVLMFAARSGDMESVRLLLEAGVDVEAREAYRGTVALHWAAEQGYWEVVSLLLAHGANPNLRSAVIDAGSGAPGRGQVKGGMSALLLASREGEEQTVAALLAGGALVNQQSADGNTALLVAVQNGHVALANQLLEHGADPSLANDKGWTPLYLAVKARTMEVGTMPNPDFSRAETYALIENLLSLGAMVNARITANTEVRNAIRATWLEEDGATAFLRAAMGGDLPVMELLLAHGADPMIATRDGTTALMALAGVGFTNGFMEDLGGHELSLQAMELLLSLGLDVNAKNNDGTMALHGACHKNFVGAIQLLVDHGADLTARSYRRGTFERSETFNGYTPLDWAQGVQTGGESALYNPEATELMEKILVEHGVPIERNSNTRGGRVAVH